MNCMLETGSVKIKVERLDSEEETINEQITGEGKRENPADRCKGRGAQPPRQKLKTTSHRKSNGIDKKLDASDMVIKTEHDEDKEEDDEEAQECDSDMDKVRVDKVKVKLKVGRKKRKERSKQRRPEMAELIVGRRMASLNASAMMQVGRGRACGQ
jgi:hypothetical protein